MAVTDYGIGIIGSLLVGDDTSSFIGSLGFGTGGSAFNGSSTHLTTEIIRVPITWTRVGRDIRSTGALSAVQANGSYIQELGLVFGATAAGSDAFSLDSSAIGSKNNLFSVTIQQDVRIRRF